MPNSSILPNHYQQRGTKETQQTIWHALQTSNWQILMAYDKMLLRYLFHSMKVSQFMANPVEAHYQGFCNIDSCLANTILLER
jgi:hypothetical protein